jgi:hypothetical protein
MRLGVRGIDACSSVLSMLTPATSGRLASAISSARRFASSRQPFAQGLADIEFVEERNVHIEYRWAEGDYGHKPSAYEVKAVVRRTWSQADIGQIEIPRAAGPLDVGKAQVTGQHWPQPSMPSPFRQIYLDVKGEQSIEQLGLTIKMMLAEPAARNLFGALLE